MTFAELRDEADRLAAGLIALGLRPGDRVGLWSPNRIEWVLAQYATAKAGLILVNLNPGYRAGELEYALNKVECRALITADQFKTTHYIGILRELAPELEHCATGALRSARLPHLTTVVHIASTDEPGCYTLDEVRALGGSAERTRLAELAELLQPDDPINIQFTSGTTGSPKAATLTHHGLINNAFFFAEGAGVQEGQRFCNPLPLYHVGGMVLGSILGILRGVTLVYLGEAFDPLAALDAIRTERCVAFGGVPTMFVAMTGAQGEICFRGHMVMRGYWNGEAQTRETIDAARWLHSGDLGTMDADGYITITGRSKDMVIRGGENIYPREIEEFLFGHPAVADVQVFGVPDPRYGEELCAWIRLRPGAAATEEEIRGFCRDRITHFKIPRYVRFVHSFPMTVTGKVQKFVMREMMAAGLAAGPTASR
jgi:acyl-CoA synthetase (AMP-forming)/AMP-acid ligase II